MSKRETRSATRTVFAGQRWRFLQYETVPNQYLQSCVQQAVETIMASETVGAVCHVRPDGDALGSMLGFAEAARLAGKQIRLAVPSPGIIPNSYRFLPTNLLEAVLEPHNPPATVVVFDCGSADRLGNLASLAGRVENLVVVDHHVSNAMFGTVNVVDPAASATVELVYDLLAGLRWPVNKTVAMCLLAGLTTDTGRFQYASTSPRSHRLAARLLEAGARPEVIGQAVFEEEPFGLLAVAGAVLGRARLEPSQQLVWSILQQEDLEAASLTVEDTALMVDLVRLPREADMAMLIRETGNNTLYVTLRSRGGTNVGRIAAVFGGGGHRNAAGFVIEGTAEAIAEKAMSEIPTRCNAS